MYTDDDYPAKVASVRSEAGLDLVDEAVDGHADLLGGVAVADGDGLVLDRLEVDGDRQRRSDLFLASVAAPDGLGVVLVHEVPGPQQSGHLVAERQERL